ncbi:hypothetical protein EG328_008453 [Venturia inaequalis]|uniref:Uncharacterized protein n=1 Tax=Venturia inaequalis TaxID=5025 RepID=A0A8H3VCU2_VENIN|nr:hypothetical protein EG327_007795 [Venturia inaequalis]KAE9984619.1 hypothetical protein EG328_008453 [Venturia inaequalis]RDI87169.1 hypothetical protein Vi05172_g2797 [Venturia inaequalis]
MTSPLQRKLFESHLTTSPPWIDLLHQLPIELSDYTSFLISYSDKLLSPSEDELRIEELFEDELFEDSKENETIDTDIIMSNMQQSSYCQSYSSSTLTNSSNGGAPQTWRSSESMSSNSQGTTVHRISEQPGQLPLKETLRYEASGKLIGEQPATSGRIEDVSEADTECESAERMEGEYAIRERGV